MHPTRFGIVLLPESIGGFGALCREAEESGFDLLGVADSQSVFRELYVALTLAALNTRRVRLGPLVTNPLTRHLVVTASAISSIDELSGGRAMLGIGSGDSAIFTLGAPPATVAGLEDAAGTLAASPAACPSSAAAGRGTSTARPAACPSTSPRRGRGRSSWPDAWPTGSSSGWA